MEALGLNEEVIAQWRRSLEQTGLALPLPGRAAPIPGDPLTPPSSGLPPAPASPPTSSPAAADKSPSRHSTPEGGAGGAGDRPSSIGGGGEDLTNGGSSKDSKPPSEDGEPGASPVRLDSKSPFKGGVSPPPPGSTMPPSLPSPLHQNPHLHNSVMGLPLPMGPLAGVPPLFSTSRIPKSDPMEARLQDMLRYNMEKYAGQALDTLGMSRRVRELLSIHNIGQRLFAKYVLGLSQGTVSELLSKPKAWEKLTEKGRDSYRKMHAWCYDENAVMLLKSLIPRKGELMRPAPLLMKGKLQVVYSSKNYHR